ncbi:MULTISPECIES: hypothetical protein [Brochothrix]|uniref:Uncharacterized protein n=1 Tax=Brochothrix thermosphacta TaxID=2756 RepID=A0A2X0QIP6_BROTH|nr:MULTISPECIES: hypothetical protein [Brochothrix]SLN05640.1 hypothetical protein FM106_31185 [Brachybacterium faecium]MBR5525473.1 hypothetical protein [Brochothrix sp.]MDO7865147.1 hypothetical protein [Brochothrix thermosphacta]WKK69716.1 hypothetical protein Q0G00_03810 [Brochothrix thermosphacta]SOC31191.1 hypothetical protein BTH160X_60014 [Brochothrix thermosphacta]
MLKKLLICLAFFVFISLLSIIFNSSDNIIRTLFINFLFSLGLFAVISMSSVYNFRE